MTSETMVKKRATTSVVLQIQLNDATKKPPPELYDTMLELLILIEPILFPAVEFPAAGGLQG